MLTSSTDESISSPRLTITGFSVQHQSHEIFFFVFFFFFCNREAAARDSWDENERERERTQRRNILGSNSQEKGMRETTSITGNTLGSGGER